MLVKSKQSWILTHPFLLKVPKATVLRQQLVLKGVSGDNIKHFKFALPPGMVFLYHLQVTLPCTSVVLVSADSVLCTGITKSTFKCSKSTRE